MRNVGFIIRVVIGLVFVVGALIRYYSNSSYNEVLDENQRLGLTKEDEINLGRYSEAEMAYQYGGLSQDSVGQQRVKAIGKRIVANSDAGKSGYPFEFYLLADAEVVNAFALPGGPVFVTQGLYNRMENEDELAGVVGHEIGHVVARHSAQQIAKQQLAQGISGAAVVLAGDYNSGYMVQVISNLVNMKYSRQDELEADKLGIRFMIQAGYDPHAMIRVMEILDEASGGQQVPEFESTHPSPANRIEHIKQDIEEYSQTGVSY